MLVIALPAVMMLASPARGHPGGLAGDVCHNDRKAGTRHCHRGASQASMPNKKHQRSGGVHYRNCDSARAAGAAPVKRGQPGYGSHLDRDNDGIGCE